MPEQDILFLLSGDAQGAIDALNGLLSVLGDLDNALQTLASSLAVLNDVEAALSAMGGDEAPIVAVADAVATLDETLATADAGAAQGLAQGINDIAQSATDAQASIAGMSQVMNEQAAAMVADAQAAADAATANVQAASAQADIAVAESDAAAAGDALAQTLTLVADAQGLTAESANAVIDALVQAGMTEQGAISILDDYQAGLLYLNTVSVMAGVNLQLVADGAQNVAASFAPASAEATNFAIAQADATSGMASWITAEGDLVAANTAVESSVQGVMSVFEALDQLLTQLVSAVLSGTDSATAVNDVLIQMGEAGITATTALDALETVCATLGIDFSDLLVNVYNVRDAMGMVAPEADAFTSSFTNAQLAAGVFGQTLSTIPGAIMDATTAMGEMAVAEEEVAGAADTKNTALREQADASQNDAYMVLVLLQFLLQAVRGFAQMGMGAQDSIAKLSGLADQSLAGAAGLSKLNGVISQLETDSIKFGVTLKDASDGLYYIMSAGFNTKDSLLILQSSMEASAATGAKMNTVSSALTSILNAYGMTAKQAATVTNQMVQSIVSGKTTAQDYANSIGNLAAVAKMSGFSFIDATSALSTFTQINGRTRQDAQNLAQMFQVLGLRADDTAKAARNLGLHFDETHYKTLDLAGRLQYLAQVAGGDNTTAFGKLLLNATATRAAFSLLTNNGKNLADVLKAVSGSTHALDTAFAESEKTITASVNHMQAALSVLAYQLTVMATPTVKAMLDGVTQAFAFMASHIEILEPVLAALAIIVGGLLVTAFQRMLEMMWPIIASSVAAYAPLALLVAVAILLAHGLEFLAARSAPLRTALATLQTTLNGVGSVLNGLFNAAVQRAGQLLQQLGAWAQANVLPPLTQIAINFVRLATVIAANIVPGLTQFMTTMQPVGAFIMGTIVPAIGQFIVQALKIAVVISGNIVPIFNTLRSILIPLGVVIAGFGAAWAVIAGSGAIATVVSIVTSAVAIFGFFGVTLGSLVTALGVFLWAIIAPIAPLIGIGLAIGIAVLGFVRLWQSSALVRTQFATVGQAAMQLWDVFKANIIPVFQELWSDVQAQIIPAFQQLWTALQPLAPYAEMLGRILGGILLAAFVLLIGAIAGIIAGLGQFLRGLVQVFTGIVQIFTGIVSLISTILALIIAIFTNNNTKTLQLAQQLGDSLKTIFTGIGNVIGGIVRAFIGTVGALLGQFFTTVIKIFTDLANNLVGHSIWPDMFTAMTQVLTGWISQVISTFVSFIAQVITVIATFSSQMQTIFRVTWAAVQSIWQTVLAALAALLSGNFSRFVQLIVQAGAQMQATMQTAWEAIQRAVQAGIANILSAVQGFVAHLGSIFSNLAAQAFSWGSDFMSQMASGVASAGANVVAAAQNIAGKVASLLHFSVPDEGPLADADKWMPDFGDLLAGGLTDQVNKVGNAASRMAMSVQMAAPSSSDIARYSSPAAPTAATDTASVQVLQAILAELQQQRAMGGRMSIGHNLPGTALGTVTQSFGGATGVTKIHDQYQQLNTLAGIAYENGMRGSVTGLGV